MTNESDKPDAGEPVEPTGDELFEANKRITDLEGWHCASVKELAEAREVSAALVEQLRGLSAAHTSTVRDLRDRDHELSLANARGNRLQAQLTEANRRVDTLLTERQKLEIEMAEARGELRRITESDFAHQIRLSRAVGDVKTTEVTIAALHAWRAKTSAAQSPSVKECNGPGCSYPDGCPKCNPLGTPTQSPSSADSDARECPDCYDGGVCLPGGCGIDSCERCGKMCPTCNGSHELPASPPYETAPTLEKGVSNCEACNGDGDNGFFGTCLECGGEGVVRGECAPAEPAPVTHDEPRMMGPLEESRIATPEEHAALLPGGFMGLVRLKQFEALEDRVRRLENMMILKDDLKYNALAEEIRAEREARKL